MTSLKKLFIIFTFLLSFALGAETIKVCSAENFYGNVVESIGGKYVQNISIISNPDADPHLFATSPKTAIAISKADIIVYNGADYDPWIIPLISSSKNRSKAYIIDVADLMQIKSGANPHLWYNPKTFPELAQALCLKFSELIPAEKDFFEANLKKFNENYSKVTDLVASIKSKYSGTAVTATEPVFGYMAEALGFDMKGTKFQWIIMNGSDPSPKITKNFLSNLQDKKVSILYYNDQVISPTTSYILKTAKDNSIPTIGVSETMPENSNAADWLYKTLQETENALKAKKAK